MGTFIDEYRMKILAIAMKNGLSEVAHRLNLISPETIQVKAAFLGEFNSGKTTIVNALLRKKLLPTYDIPTTAVITEIARGNQDDAFVVYKDENGVTSKKSIELSDLAEECMVLGQEKKIFITIKDIDFLSENVVLIDTPGIASINEMHSDISYGYLSLVDVAFIVINPLVGDIPKTLIRFLKQFPEDLIEKLYFIISRADQVSDETMSMIISNISRSLSEIQTTPKIFSISGTNALDAVNPDGSINEYVYENSGIGHLIEIIKDFIPKYKKTVEAKRIKEMLDNEKITMIGLLEMKASTLNWNTEQFDSQIAKYKEEILLIENEIFIFKNRFQSSKQKILKEIEMIAEEYATSIGTKISRDESFEILLTSMLTEMKQRIEIGIAELKAIEFRSVDSDKINIADILKALIETETSSIKDFADILTDAATFALTMLVVPGASPSIDTGEAIVGSGIILAQEADNKAYILDQGYNKKSILTDFSKLIGTVGKIIKDLNPLEKIKKAVLPYILNPRLALVLKDKTYTTIKSIYDIIEISINKEIKEKYLIPLKDKKTLLNDNKRIKSEYFDQVGTVKNEIEIDLEILKSIA